MKYILYIILISGVSSIAYAQPTLNNFANYSIGDSTKYMSCDTTGFNPGTSGVNQTWNFSNLTVVDSSIHAVIHRNSASNGGQFPNASFVEVFDGNEIYIENNASQYAVGGLSLSGIIIKYPNTQINYMRPATYQDTLVDTFTSDYNAMSFNVKGGGVIRTKVDGYGTLILPDSTYTDVLRFKSEFEQVDTIQGLPGPGNLIFIKSHVYIWFDSSHTNALLRVDSVDIKSPVQNTTVYTVNYYKAAQPVVGINSLTSDKVIIGCYMGNGILKISADFDRNSIYKVYAYNTIGQAVYSSQFKPSGDMYLTDIPDLPSGVYYISLHADNQPPVSVKVYKQ